MREIDDLNLRMRGSIVRGNASHVKRDGFYNGNLRFTFGDDSIRVRKSASMGSEIFIIDDVGWS